MSNYDPDNTPPPPSASKPSLKKTGPAASANGAWNKRAWGSGRKFHSLTQRRRDAEVFLRAGLAASRGSRVNLSCCDHAVVRNRESKNGAVPFRVFVFVVATFDPDSDPDLDETVKP